MLLGVIAIGAMFWKRSYNRLFYLALAWAILSLPTLYFLNSFFGFFLSKVYELDSHWHCNFLRSSDQ